VLLLQVYGKFVNKLKSNQFISFQQGDDYNVDRVNITYWLKLTINLINRPVNKE